MPTPETATSVRAPARGPSTRVAALDGLRGLALIGMLAWHAQLDWIQGGFARMTIFFVLSGFLATKSLQRLRASSGRGSTWAYLRRRLHRLLPLTLLGVAAAIAVTVAVGSVAARRSMQGDVLSVLAGVSNWRMIAESRSYGELFESPSAFQHFWSLSAEEQCIWLLPIVLAITLAVTRRRPWPLVAATSAALLAIPLVVAQSPDAIYYGTPNRAGEFLAGSALALWLAARPSRSSTTWIRPTQVVGAASLAVLLLVMLSVNRETPWLYRGGLALVVLPVVGLLLAISTHGGVASRVLSIAPLAVLGRWALSIYVLHWPLYLLMEEGRIGLDGTALAITQILAAIALGGLVHRFVERPLLPRPSSERAVEPASAGGTRARGPMPDRALFGVLGGVAALLVAVAVAVPTPAPVYDFAAAEARSRQGPSTSPIDAAADSGDVAVDAETVSVAAPAINVGVFGGSTGVLLGAAVYDWAAGEPDIRAVPAWSAFGCGFVSTGEYLGRDPLGNPERVRPDATCAELDQAWPEATRVNQVEVALVVTGVWETTDWILDGHDAPLAIVDPEFDQLVRTRVAQVVDGLTSEGARVIIAGAPNIGPGTTGTARADRGLPDDHARRVAIYNQILRDVAAARDDVTVIYYGSYVDSLAPSQSVTWLPDGIHPTDAAALAIWAEFLGPQIRDVVATNWPQLIDG